MTQLANYPSSASLSLQVSLAVLEKPWPQNPLMRPSEFVSYAKKRGFWISEENLETWDRLGIFPPVLKMWRPYSYHVSAGIQQGMLHWYEDEFDGIPMAEQMGEDEGKVVKIYRAWDSPRQQREFYLKNPQLLMLTEQEFVSWDKLRDGHETIGYVRYHPFQIFRLQHIQRLLQLNWSLPNFHAPENMVRWIQSDLDRSLAHLKTSLNESLSMLLLLLRIEDKYLPDFRGARPLRHIVGEGQPIQEFDDWEDSFSPQKILEKSEVTTEQVQKMRNDVAQIGRDIDPNRSWFMLLRHVDHKRRQKLKDKALLAWDHYEAAEVLNGFLRALTGEKQPHVDDLGFGSHWKQDYYGIAPEDVDYNLANTLPLVLRHYNLDPRPRVLLILEGESEQLFTQTWCELMGINLEREGIRVLSLGGTSDLSADRTEKYVAQAVKDGVSVVLAVDNENQVIRHLRKWRRAKWISRIYPEKALLEGALPTGATLWRPCFEDANFTQDELVESWHSLLLKNPRVENVDLEMLKAKVNELRPAYATNIQTLLKASKVLRLSCKKTELAQELARQHFQDTNKPIVLLLQKTVRLATLTSIYNLPGRRSIGT